MGGARIINITQSRRGQNAVDVTIAYNPHRVTRNEPLPSSLEIQVVSLQTGELIFDEQPDGVRSPVRQAIPAESDKVDGSGTLGTGAGLVFLFA